MENTYSVYLIQNLTDTNEDLIKETRSVSAGRNLLGLIPMFLLLLLVVLRISWTLYRSFVVVIIGLFLYVGEFYCTRQKTRSPQQRRMYAGSHPRPSLGLPEPTVYVSPSNLPPPPKYEFMAPPSYEDVVGVHYPQFNAQPISQPITAALAQGSSAPPAFENVTSTVVNEARRTSVTVART